MAGARALWVANGMKKEMMGKPIIACLLYTSFHQPFAYEFFRKLFLRFAFCKAFFITFQIEVTA